MIVAALLSLMLLQPVGEAAGNPGLVADISRDVIDLRYDFSGAELLLFGAVRAGAGEGAVDIVLTVTGPPEDIVIRRKERFAVLWLNGSALRLQDAPGYYALLSNRPVREIAPGKTLAALQLLPENVPTFDKTPPGAQGFIDGFRRNRQAAGLWRVDEKAVLIREQALFRAGISLPANVPVGQYRVKVHLFQDGRLRASRALAIAIDKIGFERAVYSFSQERPLAYGLVAIVLALAAGWGASLITGRR